MPRGLMLPLMRNECFWIGLGLADQAPPISLSIAVTLQSGEVVDALSGERWNAVAARALIVGGSERVVGIRRPDGMFDALARDTVGPSDATSVRFVARIAPLNDRKPPLDERNHPSWDVTIHLVDYAQFTAECGVPAPDPPDPGAAFKGWLLP